MKKKYFLIVPIILSVFLFCSCGNKKEEEKPGEEQPPVDNHLAHSWTEWDEEPATCTKDGRKERECTVCHKVETESILALNHKYINGFCTRCGEQDPLDTSFIDEKEFSFISITEDGVLSFSKLKCASKYTLKMNDSEIIEIDKKDGSYSLKDISTGTTSFVLTAYEEIEVEGTSYKQEIAISEATEEFKVTKLNQKFSLERLKYKDEHITLQGFYNAKVDNKYYLYDQVLKDNKPMNFKITNFVKVSSGDKLLFYKSASGRQNADSNDTWDSTNLLMGYPQIKHGDNFYYVRVVDTNGNHFDYDLNVYGLYTVEISRYQAKLGTNEEGYRAYETEKLGQTLTIVEKDIIPLEVLYEDVSNEEIGRDAFYNILEKEDYKLIINNNYYPDYNNKIQMNIYFYDEAQVREDHEEYMEYEESFSISENDYGISLSSSGNLITGEITIPAVLVGKKILSVDFFSSEVTSIYISEGTQEFVLKFGYCYHLTDIWLPSTITSMNEFAFGGNPLDTLPKDMTIHCAFDSQFASSFPFKWNYIAGTTKTFNTIYGEATPIEDNGIKYKIVENELVVTGAKNSFDGQIPDTVKISGRVYPVTKIESLEDITSLKIGKNISFIAEDAFNSSLETIEVDPENLNFVLEDGILYNIDKNRIIVVTKKINTLYLTSNILYIDKNAFTNCEEVTIYTPLQELPLAWEDCDFNNVSFVFDYQGTIIKDGFEYILTNSNTACLVSYKNEEKNVIVNEFVNGLQVTEISNEVFKDAVMIESIVIPDSILKLGTDLFKGCTNLKNITLPFIGTDLENATTLSMIIGEDCLASLESITITKATSLADEVFSGCVNLNEINLPESLNSVGNNVFKDCTNLEYNKLDDAYYLGNLVHPYILLVWVEKKEVTEIVINEDCRVICEDAFTVCNDLTKVTLPVYLLNQFPIKTITHLVLSSGEKIETDDLNSYSLLESISLPSSIQEIKNDVFNNLIHLTELEIAVENLYYSSLDGIVYNKEQTEIICLLPGLTKVSIPNTITTLKRGVFANLKNIMELELPFAFGGEDNLDNDSQYLGYLFSTKQTEGAYYTNINVPTSLRKVILTGGTKLGSEAFFTCDSIREIILPDTLTEIGTWSLACDYLESLTIPFIEAKLNDGSTSNYFKDYFQSVTINGKKTWYVPTSLSYVKITGNDRIPNYAFEGCSSINEISIPDDIEGIGEKAFEDCNLIYTSYEDAYYLGNEDNPYVVLIKLADKNLTEYRIHEDTKIIYYKAFASTKMSSISIPYGVRVIGISAFESSEIKEIELPDSLEIIDTSAFSFSKLESITIPGSTKIISENAFYENKSLKSVTLLEGVEIIGEQAFYECWSLEDVSLPNSLTDIRYAAFACSASSLNYNIYENAYYLGNEDNPYLCLVQVANTSITSCKIDQQTKFIMDYAFSFCNNLKEIILTKDLMIVNESALYNCNKFNTIYYLGTEEEWNEISILNDNYNFETGALRYYYSEEEPTSEGNYWHYVEDVPTLW